MPEGYCTLEDLRSALQKSELPGDLSQDTRLAIDAIEAQTEPLEKELMRHWYAPAGADILTEADQIAIPTAPKTRDDEYSIPTSGVLVADDAGIEPQTAQGDYAAISLDRRDADTVAALHVRQEDGTYEDWAASADYTEGSWPPSGEDYYLRTNNHGWSRLYVDVTNLLEENEDDEYVLDSWANAVYMEFSYGHEGIPQNVRRAVALRAAAMFVDEAAVQIPDNARVSSVETLASKFESRAEDLLEVYR